MKNLITLFSILFLFSEISFSQTWTRTLDGRSVWNLAKDSQGNVFAGGLTSSNSRIWKTTNAGGSWDTVFIGSGQTMWDFAFDPQGTMYVANYSTGVLKSTDYGANFTLIPSSAFNNKNVQGVECGSSGYIFINTNTGFLRSTDNGASFTETALSGFNCLPVLVDIDSSNIVYVGVTGASNVGFYRSTNNGLTFSPNLNPGKNGYNLIQLPNGDLYMITTTSPYNFDKSTNKGLTWTTISNSPPSQRGIMYSLSGNFFTSGNGGVFRSTNNGLSFTNFNFTLSATPILSVNYNSTLKVFTGVSGAANGGVWISDEGPAPVIKINLTALIEGMYNTVSNQLSRNDSIKLYLRDAAAPYRMRDSSASGIDSVTFSGLFTFSNTPTGTYYLVARHFNSLETWSKSGGEPLTGDGSIYNYDFTTSASQAYGSNLQLKGTKYCFYSGDVNQDGTIDLSDVGLIDNDAFNIVSGFAVTDLNADGIVDIDDTAIADNNVYNFVGVVRP